jgi:hypothetical protein
MATYVHGLESQPLAEPYQVVIDVRLIGPKGARNSMEVPLVPLMLSIRAIEELGKRIVVLRK